MAEAAAQEGHDIPEVHRIKGPDDQRIGDKGVETIYPAAGNDDAGHFLQDAQVVRCVAKPEGDTGCRKGIILKRQVHGITFLPGNVSKRRAFFAGYEASDLEIRPVRCQGNSDVPSATAHIQDTAALGCLLTDSFDEAVFPTAFHAETDAPVGAVISLGNLLEYMIYLLPF